MGSTIGGGSTSGDGAGGGVGADAEVAADADAGAIGAALFAGAAGDVLFVGATGFCANAMLEQHIAHEATTAQACARRDARVILDARGDMG